jgi:hypothetical protein
VKRPDDIADGLEGAAAKVEDLEDALLDGRGSAAADLQDDVVNKLQLEQAALQPRYKQELLE